MGLVNGMKAVVKGTEISGEVFWTVTATSRLNGIERGRIVVVGS
jgi:hypothetical protein